MQFLADSVPEAGLIPPAGTMERLRVQEWLNFIATEYHKQFIWLLRGAPPDVLAAQTEKVRKVLAELDAHLLAGAFMVGDRFTVVDAYVFAITRWCSLERVRFDLGPFPAVQAFMARVAQRPAVQAALRTEGLSS